MCDFYIINFGVCMKLEIEFVQFKSHIGHTHSQIVYIELDCRAKTFSAIAHESE